HFIVVRNPRQLARNRGHGDSSRGESANHESSVGKYCAARGNSIRVFNEFHTFIAHQEDSMAEYSL
ncbi:MAG: hypothetical protein QOJ41_2499, partial [Acidobacteriaceae bacterium]|nr:hypothetical protein [Acidobacteriaceae bacterium]